LLGRSAIAILATTFVSLPAAAEPREGFSVAAGGLVLPPSVLLLVKGAYEHSHFAVSVDLTRDSVVIDRAGGDDRYALYGVSVGGRAYTGATARGGFAEVSLGYASLHLASERDHSTRSDATGLPLAGFTLGARIGQVPKGLFGELGYRGSFSLGERLLHTADVEPAGARDESLSDRAWYFPAGAFNAQLYLAVGWSF
jgi:hypothetical protein